jgi:hypothetical protein
MVELRIQAKLEAKLISGCPILPPFGAVVAAVAAWRRLRNSACHEGRKVARRFPVCPMCPMETRMRNGVRK